MALSDLLQIFQDATWVPFSYSIWKLHAALRNPAIEGLEVAIHEPRTPDAERVAEEILAGDPDVVGFSAYLWSFPTFAAVTRILKARKPSVKVLFGGPSGRPVMFDLPEYRDVKPLVDAICMDEGEFVLRDVMQAKDLSGAELRAIPGLALPSGDGWFHTPHPKLPPLDGLDSPYQLGLVPKKRGANLETFRGCPLSCSFCEWGAMASAGRVWSEEYLTRELAAIQASEATSLYLIDAGLNLNRRAFRNLAAAEKKVGLLRSIPVGLHIYASAVNEQDATFLENMMVGRLGIGLQSFNPDVNKKLQRPFDEARFLRGVDLLREVRNTVIELIMGLPYDSPASFKESVRRSLELPVAGVQIFHSLVLPDGLMTRAPEGSDLVFDHRTLKTVSAKGWSERDLAETAEWLSREAEKLGGSWDETMWRLPARGRHLARTRAIPAPERIIAAPGPESEAARSSAPSTRAAPEPPSGQAKAPEDLWVPLEHKHAIGMHLQERSGGTWKLIDVRRLPDGRLSLTCSSPIGPFEFVTHAAPKGAECFVWHDGIAVSHLTDLPRGRVDHSLFRELATGIAKDVKDLMLLRAAAPVPASRSLPVVST